MIITIIIIIIRRRRRRIVFMLLSSWCVKSHCQSSSGSFDWCRLSAKWTPNTNHHNKSTNFGYETHGPTKEGARLSRPIIRPQCMHSVHKMRPIATYGVAWSVCLCACMSVCRSRSWALQKSWTDLDAVWETDSGVSKDLLDWRLDPQREWAILGVVRPIEKHWESWLRCTQKKRLNRSRCHLGWLMWSQESKYVFDGDQDRTNPFAAARGDKMPMRPFVGKILWPLVYYWPA